MTDSSSPLAVKISTISELCFIVLLIALGALCYDTTVPVDINFLVPEVLDSALYSQIVGIFLIVTSLYHAFMLFRNEKQVFTLPFSTILGFFLVIVYVVFFTYIGFYTSTLVYLVIFSFIIEERNERNLKTKIVFSIGSVVILYLVFSTFKIYLPSSILY